MNTLRQLINTAVRDGRGKVICAHPSDHVWKSIGGRGCPENLHCDCSQTVYECETCGKVDYGAKDGPAHDECTNHCEFEWMKKHRPTDNRSAAKELA